MLYEIGYVACALIVMAIIGYRFFRRKRVYTLKNFYFGVLINLGIFQIEFDIWSAYCVSYAPSLNRVYSFIICQIFYLLQFLLPFLTYTFDYVLTNNFKKYIKVVWYCSVPCIVCLILWLLNIFTPTIFYFDEVGNYIKPALNIIVYISAFYYMACTSITAVLLRKEMGRQQARIMFIGGVSCILIGIFQYIHPYTLATGLASLIISLLLYLFLDNNESLIDPLTDCFEKSALDEYLNGGLVSRKDGYAIAVSFVNFSSINAVFGLETGDSILRQAGHFMNKAAYKYGTNAYRLMGDIFLLHFHDFDKYYDCLEYLRKEVNKPFEVNGTLINLKCNIFKIENIDYIDKINDLTQVIKFAINEAKDKNLTGEVLLDRSFREKYNYQSAIETYLRKAIDEKSLYMEYQPIYSLKDNKFTMLEALVRLNHPTYGRISPDIFIKVAEKYGLVSDITNQVLDMVSDFVSKNNLPKYGIDNVKINLSAIDLMDVNLKDRIEKIFDKKNVNSDIIGFEITETAATNYNNESYVFLKYAKEKKLRLSMDDFGSGYANLSNAMKIDFEVIKLDRSMLLAIDETKEGKEIYKSLAKLFQKFNKKIVAEGAESEKEVSLLKKWGVDYIQGYYYSKPLGQKELIKLLKTNK